MRHGTVVVWCAAEEGALKHSVTLLKMKECVLLTHSYEGRRLTSIRMGKFPQEIGEI